MWKYIWRKQLYLDHPSSVLLRRQWFRKKRRLWLRMRKRQLPVDYLASVLLRRFRRKRLLLMADRRAAADGHMRLSGAAPFRCHTFFFFSIYIVTTLKTGGCMDKRTPLPMTPFDTLTSSGELQMVKLLLPYTPPAIQRMLAFSSNSLSFRTRSATSASSPAHRCGRNSRAQLPPFRKYWKS